MLVGLIIEAPALILYNVNYIMFYECQLIVFVLQVMHSPVPEAHLNKSEAGPITADDEFQRGTCKCCIL